MSIVKRRGEGTEPLGRPSLKFPEGPMEPFTCTLAVRFMSQENSLSEKQRGAPIFDNTTVHQTKVEESINGASALG